MQKMRFQERWAQTNLEKQRAQAERIADALSFLSEPLSRLRRKNLSLEDAQTLARELLALVTDEANSTAVQSVYTAELN